MGQQQRHVVVLRYVVDAEHDRRLGEEARRVVRAGVEDDAVDAPLHSIRSSTRARPSSSVTPSKSDVLVPRRAYAHAGAGRPLAVSRTCVVIPAIRAPVSPAAAR